jgi:hypothetical protein
MKMRWSIVITPYSIGVLVLLSAATGCASSAQPPVAADQVPAVVAAAGGVAGPIPGTDPGIQRWLLDSGPAKIAFNDALLRAERGVAGNTASQCKSLSSAIQALVKVLPKLAALSPAGQKLAAAIQPPLTTFDSAATACLAKNFPAAQTALDAGVVQQADAQATVDEILDGDL